VRSICHPNRETNATWFNALADDVAQWMDDDAVPYVFVHCANNEKAPPIARDAHEAIRNKSSRVEEMPEWPGEAHETRAGQMSML
jgi:hypothetical protein